MWLKTVDPTFSLVNSSQSYYVNSVLHSRTKGRLRPVNTFFFYDIKKGFRVDEKIESWCTCEVPVLVRRLFKHKRVSFESLLKEVTKQV